MNLIIHQFRKDLYYTRYLFGFWLALIIAQFSLAGWNARPSNLVMTTLLPMLSTLLTFTSSIFVLLLIPLIVFQEPLVGTTAFWFTRPLSRGTLLSAKFLYICLLGTLPILIQVVLFITNGVTLHDILLAIPQLGIMEAYWIVMIAVFAVLTPDYARFAVLGVSVFVLWGLVISGVSALKLFHDPVGVLGSFAGGSLSVSRSLVGSIVTITLGVSLILVQYLRRNFPLAVSLLAVGFVLILVVQFLWSWDFMKSPVPLVKDRHFKPDFVGVRIVGGSTATSMIGLIGGKPTRQIQRSVAFSNVPEGYFMKVESIESSLKTSDGLSLPFEQDPNITMPRDINLPALTDILGGANIFSLSNMNLTTTLFSLSKGNYSRYGNSSLDYSGLLHITAYKYVITAALPLRKGSHFEMGSEKLRINEILEQPKGVDVLFGHQTVHLVFGNHGDQGKTFGGWNPQSIYLLLNRKRNEAFGEKMQSTFTMAFNQPLSGDILNTDHVTLSYGADDNSGFNPGSYAPALDKKWLADAVLLKIDAVPVDRFTRQIHIPDFRISGGFNPYQSIRADPTLLETISLPPNPTKDQARDYINQILKASAGQNTFSDQDPQIPMLEKVGPHNVDLLVDIATRNRNFYVSRAINFLALPEHKDLIIAACASNKDLMDTIVDHDWQSDAEPLIMQFVNSENPNSYFPVSWIAAVASLRDPTTYDFLKSYYLEHHTPDVTAVLQGIPDFGMAEVVDRVWKGILSKQAPQCGNFLLPAVQYGEPGILDIAMASLLGGDEYMKQQARMAFQKFTPAQGMSDPQLIAWYAANKAALTYDPQAKRFVLGPLGSPAPSSGQVMPTDDSMRELGRQAAAGDMTAIDKIDDISKKLSQGLDYSKDRDRVQANHELLRAAFDEIGKSIQGDDPNNPAFKALLYACGKNSILVYEASFTFGAAAAKGNHPALDVLLNYNKHGIPLTTAIDALGEPAQHLNPGAVDFLVKIVDTDSDRSLWRMASDSLGNAAAVGNVQAQQALAKFAASQHPASQHPGGK